MMTGRNILTATLADGRRGTLLRTTTLLILSLAVALTVATVAMGQETATPADDVAATVDREPVTVVVDNQAWADMRVYVLQNGQRFRVGTAYSFRTTTIEIPEMFQADVRGLDLLAVPIGGDPIQRSGPVLVDPGDILQWTLLNRRSHSSVMPIG